MSGSAPAPDILQQIRKPGVNLAIWQRPEQRINLAPDLQALMETSAFQKLALKNHLFRIPTCSQNDLPDPKKLHSLLQKIVPGLEIVAPDMADLFRHYAHTVTKGAHIKSEIRIQFIPAATKTFHQDRRKNTKGPKDIRQICVYYGDCPDWLEDRGAVSEGKLKAKALSDDYVHTVGNCDVLMIQRGGDGIYHRMPPQLTAKARIVTIMDAVL